MTTYRLFRWVAIAATAVASTGCMGGGGTTPLASADPSASSQHFAQQAADQRNRTLSSPMFGQSASEPTPAQTTNPLLNNPVSRAVKGAFSQGAALGSASSAGSKDSLSLNHPAKPPTPELYVAMGLMAEHSHDAEKAAEFYQQAVEMEPRNADTLLAFGRFQDRQGRLGDAAALYLAAVEADPNHAGARNDLGLCYARQGHLPQALALIRQAVQMRPDRPIYRNNLAKVLVETGRPQEAVSELSSVFPPAQAYYNVGCFLAQSGAHEDAANHFAMAVQMDPQMQNAREWLARLRPNAVAAVPQGTNGPRVTAPVGSYSPTGINATAAQEVTPWNNDHVLNARLPVIAASSANAMTGARLEATATSSPRMVPPQISYAPATYKPAQSIAQTQSAPTNGGLPTYPETYPDTSQSPIKPPKSDDGFWAPQGGLPSPYNQQQPTNGPPAAGRSHTSPWGNIPSPYDGANETSSLRHPQSVATTPLRDATQFGSGPATINNPFAAPYFDRNASVHQASGQY